MSEEAINPLRRRMIEDVRARDLDEATQRGYLRSVRTCCRYCGRGPGQLTFEDIRGFQLHLMESGLKPASVNGAMIGLRFFFRVTLRRPEALDYIPMAREPQRLPVVMTQEEVARLLEASPGLKWRTALSVAYGAGLRASEVVALKVGDIDSRRMRIRVEQGTHRVAISSSRLVSMDDNGVTFRWKDYRRDGPARRKLMTLAPAEFIRRFLIHVLPASFHRIRHYGLFANPTRAANLAQARALLHAPHAPADADPETAAEPAKAANACPCCGGRMVLVELFERGATPSAAPPRPPIRIDTS